MNATLDKQGYKYTEEFGYIPEDWEVKTISKVTRYVDYRGKTPQKVNDGVFLITAKNIKDGYIDYDCSKEYIKLEDYDIVMSRGIPNIGDVLITTEAPYGKVAQINKNNIALAQRVIKYSSFDYQRLNNTFLKYCFLSKSFQTNLDAIATGGTVKGIKGSILHKQKIYLPPIKEQEKIAEVLGDVDSLIDKTQQLINKKKSLKTATMQELFTPKENWDIKKLGDIADIKDGTHQTPKYVNNGIPFYSVENITNNDFKNTKFISLEEHEILTSKYKIEQGDILMTRIGSIGDCKYIDWIPNASFYVSLALLKIKESYSAKYITQFSNTSIFKKELDDNSLPFATPKKINLGAISNIRIIIPKNKKEQEEIATILSDMDSEIEALEKELNKYKDLKTGMMQQLLTGKVRLI